MYPIDAPDMYCNVFTDDEKTGTIYSVYNNGSETSEAQIRLYNGGKNAQVIMGEGSVRLQDNMLCGTCASHDVVHVLVR